MAVKYAPNEDEILPPQFQGGLTVLAFTSGLKLQQEKRAGIVSGLCAAITESIRERERLLREPVNEGEKKGIKVQITSLGGHQPRALIHGERVRDHQPKGDENHIAKTGEAAAFWRRISTLRKIDEKLSQ